MAQLPAIKEFSKLGQYGVPVFFVISGFVFPFSLYRANYKLSSFGNFLLRRVVRIDPPFLASIVIVLILGYVSTLSPWYRGSGFHIVWTDVLLHLGYLNSFFDRPWLSPVYCTLGIEFQFYILLGLMFNLFVKSNNIARGLLIFSFLLLALLINNLSLIFPHAPLFLMGIFTFFYFEKLIDARMLIASTILFAIVSCFSYGWVGTVFTIAVSWVFYKVVEERSIKWSKKVALNKSS